MLNVESYQENIIQNRINNGDYFQQAVDSVLMMRGSRTPDGLIHCSKLDWDKPPHKQYEDCLKDGFSSLELRRYSELGDSIHTAINRTLDTFYGNPGSQEGRLFLKDYGISGHFDRIQTCPVLGNILFEFKTVSEYERDKTGADRIWKSLYKCKYMGDALVTSPEFLKHEVEIKERMLAKKKKPTKVPKHMTQMFTYGYVLSQFCNFTPDHYFLIYISRDNLGCTEFHFNSEEAKEYLNRAYVNLWSVVQCRMDYLQRTNGSSMQTMQSTT